MKVINKKTMAQTNEILTSDNIPMVILRDSLLKEKEFEYVDGVELIPGKSTNFKIKIK